MLNRLSLNKLSLNRVDLNRIGGRDVGVSGRPYIDPELLSHVKMAISTWGKTNDDPDRAILKDLTPNGNDMRLLNFGFAGNSGYGLYGANFNKWAKDTESNIDVNSNRFTINGSLKRTWVIWCIVKLPSIKIRISGINPNGYVLFQYYDNGSKILTFNKDGIYTLPSIEANSNGTGFLVNTLTLNWEGLVIEQIPDFEGWLCTDGIDDLIESVKPVSEMLEGSNEITVVSIIHQMALDPKNNRAFTNYISYYKDSATRTYLRNQISNVNKTAIYGYTYNGTTLTGIYDILGDKADYSAIKNSDTDKSVLNGKLSVCGYATPSGYLGELSQVAYAGGFIANKVLTTDEINQIIAYFNLDRPGQIIKPQLYCNIKKQGITNDNHAEFNDQLIDFVGDHNIQLNNISWEGESGIIDGALYLDGISDFGKATGLPILKDYTVVADRKILGNNEGGTLSKSYSAGNGAFIFETGSVIYSFGTGTSGSGVQSKRMLSYLSKYIYNGNPVQAGAGVDSDSMWLGTLRDGDSRFSKLVLWSLMLFPYSLSEFLLERQLRKYKAGTLYPDMVEFRPIVKSNIPYSSISYSVNPGVYVAEGSMITITITLSNETDKLVGVSSNAIADISISGDNGTYEITGKVTKPPQKINIVISSYLTTLGNDTLISNETLIKNE